MQGVLLILYMLVVSGLIAVVGDRVGYRIGKKRLTWFNLRPRHTAILVAVVTGVSISALTLGTLLLLNRSLSEALFSYTNQIAQAEQELRALNRQKPSWKRKMPLSGLSGITSRWISTNFAASSRQPKPA
jgi:uncharacterized protein (DUF3084 family)